MTMHNVWMMTYRFIELEGKGEGRTGVMTRCFDREMQYTSQPTTRTILGCLNTLKDETTDYFELQVINNLITKIQL